MRTQRVYRKPCRARRKSRRSKGSRGRASQTIHRRCDNQVSWMWQGYAPCTRGTWLLVWFRSHAICTAPLSIREQGSIWEAVPGQVYLRGSWPDTWMVPFTHGWVYTPFQQGPLWECHRAWTRTGWERTEDVQVKGQRGRSVWCTWDIRCRCHQMVFLHSISSMDSKEVFRKARAWGTA